MAAGGWRGALRRAAPVVAALSCAAPFATSALHVGRGWVPTSDSAIIATRSGDTFTGVTPLLGQPSTAGASVDRQVHHPGPLEHWSIGVGRSLADHRATSLVVVTLVNLAAVGAVLWWARAIGAGTGLALAAAVVASGLWSLRGEALVDPLNPTAATLPLAAALVGLVAVARGRRWAATTVVLAGSWAAQAHLTVTPLVAVAAVVVGVAAVARRPIADRGGAVHERARRPAPVLVAAVSFTLCWAGPIVDVVADGGGNLVALGAAGGSVEAGDGGLGAAVDRSVQALAWRPAWAQAGASLPELLAPPSAADRFVAVVVLFGGAAAALGVRRRSPAAAWTFAVGASALLAGTVLAGRLPGSFFNVFQVGNLRWLWPVSAVVWAGGLASAATSAASRLPAHAVVPLRSTVVALSTSIALGLAVAGLVEPSHRTVRRDGPAVVLALADDLAARLPAGRPHHLDLSLDLDDQVVDTGLLLELERRGFDVRVDPAYAPSFGPRRATGRAGTAGSLVVDVDPPAGEGPSGAPVVARHRPDAALAARLERAERALAVRIDGAGGPAAVVPEGLATPSSSLAFVRGDLLGLRAIGALRPEVARWSEVRTVLALRALPVQVVTVRLVAPSTPDG